MACPTAFRKCTPRVTLELTGKKEEESKPVTDPIHTQRLGWTEGNAHFGFVADQFTQPQDQSLGAPQLLFLLNVLCQRVRKSENVQRGDYQNYIGIVFWVTKMWLCVSWRSSNRGNSSPLQYSCLQNPMDTGAWWARVHGVAESQTWLKWHSMHTWW